MEFLYFKEWQVVRLLKDEAAAKQLDIEVSQWRTIRDHAEFISLKTLGAFMDSRNCLNIKEFLQEACVQEMDVANLTKVEILGQRSKVNIYEIRKYRALNPPKDSLS